MGGAHRRLRVGLCFNLASDFPVPVGAPEDFLAELDGEGTIAAIEHALRDLGHQTVRLGFGRPLLERLLAGPPCDLVFNIAEGVGTRSREAQVPALLEMLGIPHTHSDPLTLAATLDKGVAKRIVQSHGIATPRFQVVERAAELRELGLPFPLFVKPLWEGSSMGIQQSSRVVDAAALEATGGALLARYGEPVLVEEQCPGAEFTVGILGSGPSARVLGTTELVPVGRSRAEFVYSLDIKRSPDWRQHVELVTPPQGDVRAVEQVALDAYRALGCLDVGRVDVRLDAAGTPHFLEVNPLPGLAPGHSDLALMGAAVGLTYGQLIGEIVASASIRYGL